MTDDEQKAIDKAVEKIGQLIALETEKIATMRKLRRGLWLGKALDVHPTKIGKVSVKAVTNRDYVLRSPEKHGRLVIKHDGETTEIRLRNVPVWAWPDTIEAPHGPQPLKKPICDE